MTFLLQAISCWRDLACSCFSITDNLIRNRNTRNPLVLIVLVLLRQVSVSVWKGSSLLINEPITYIQAWCRLCSCVLVSLCSFLSHTKKKWWASQRLLALALWTWFWRTEGAVWRTAKCPRARQRGRTAVKEGKLTLWMKFDLQLLSRANTKGLMTGRWETHAEPRTARG